MDIEAIRGRLSRAREEQPGMEVKFPVGYPDEDRESLEGWKGVVADAAARGVQFRTNEKALFLDSKILGKNLSVKMRIEPIDKLKAQQMLSSPYEKQRNINNALIAKLVQAMNADEFIEAILNPVSISDTGKLLDGQHRLTALTQVDRTIQFLVVSGLPESTFVYFDQNRARTLKDALETSGVANAAKVAPAAKLLYQLILGKANLPRNEVAVRLVGDHPRFEKAVSFAESMTDHCHIVTSVGAVLYFLYSVHYPPACDMFFDILRHGDRDIFKRPRHPITMLSKKLTEEWKKQKAGHRYDLVVPAGASAHSPFDLRDSRHLLMSWIHQAFMAYAAGKLSLKWEPISNHATIIGEVSTLARNTVTIRNDYAEASGGALSELCLPF